MIAVEHLSKVFKVGKKQQKAENLKSSEVKAVDDVSFECRPGRVFSLLGPNGAGKTTTLRIIATILKPSEGRVSVAGHDVVADPKAVKKNLGFLTGSTGLYERLTPDELITFFGKLYDMPKERLETRKKEFFDLLDIHPFANKKIGKLSTGMKQKVSIVRTMIHDPQVLVFDEPTSGLDVISSAAIIELIRRNRERGKTIIFSTHIMGEVELLADDIAIIHEGRIKYLDTFDGFRAQMQSSSLVEEFIRIVNEKGE